MPVFAYLEHYGHNLAAGEQLRRKQLWTFIRKYLSLEVGQEYKFTRVPAGLSAIRFANSLFLAVFEKHPNLPQPHPKGTGET